MSDVMIRKLNIVRLSKEYYILVSNKTNEFEFYVLFKKTLNSIFIIF